MVMTLLKGSSDAFEHQRAVRATKTEVVFQGHIDFHVACRVGTVVQIALGIRVEQVDRWRHFLMVQRQHGEHTLNAARTTQKVTGQDLVELTTVLYA